MRQVLADVDLDRPCDGFQLPERAAVIEGLSVRPDVTEHDVEMLVDRLCRPCLSIMLEQHIRMILGAEGHEDAADGIVDLFRRHALHRRDRDVVHRDVGKGSVAHHLHVDRDVVGVRQRHVADLHDARRLADLLPEMGEQVLGVALRSTMADRRDNHAAVSRKAITARVNASTSIRSASSAAGSTRPPMWACLAIWLTFDPMRPASPRSGATAAVKTSRCFRNGTASRPAARSVTTRANDDGPRPWAAAAATTAARSSGVSRSVVVVVFCRFSVPDTDQSVMRFPWGFDRGLAPFASVGLR
nr:hypothetical protein [Nitrobacter hamburgensis]